MGRMPDAAVRSGSLVAGSPPDCGRDVVMDGVMDYVRLRQPRLAPETPAKREPRFPAENTRLGASTVGWRYGGGARAGRGWDGAGRRGRGKSKAQNQS